MNSRKWLLAVGTSSVLALGVAACGDSGSSDSTTSSSSGGEAVSGEIAGAGSSAQEAAQEAWIAGVQDQNPDLTISYDPVGSGGGREQFNAGGVDYAGSDSSFADEELTGAEKNCGGAENFVQVPAYISPIAIIYNLPDVTDLQLDAAHDRPDLQPEDHDLERPGDREAQPRRPAAGHPDHPGEPLGRLRYDQQLHPVPVEGGALRIGRIRPTTRSR